MTLVIGRRRERVQWVRDALLTTLSEFLNASFASKEATKFALRELRLTQVDQAKVDRLFAESQDALESMKLAQTRLWLIGNDELVRLAQELRDGENVYAAFAQRNPVPSLDQDREVRRTQNYARHRFVQAAKAELDLQKNRAKSVHSHYLDGVLARRTDKK